MSDKLSIGILGTGNMSRAFLLSIQNAVGAIGVKGRTPEASNCFATELNVIDWHDPSAWFNADVWVIGVKPNQFQTACVPLKSIYDAARHKPTIISLMAGVSLATLETQFPNADVVKVMANLSIATSKPVFAVNANRSLEDIPFADVLKILGDLVVLDEKEMHLATVLLGSGPAIFLAIQQRLYESGKKLGLSDVASLQLSQGALSGASALSVNQFMPQDIINQIASPGGTTEAALNVIEYSELLDCCEDAVVAACGRSIEISYNGQNNANSD